MYKPFSIIADDLVQQVSTEINQLALVLYALSICDAKHLGFDPRLTLAPRDGSLSESSPVPASPSSPHPIGTISGAQITFPAPLSSPLNPSNVKNDHIHEAVMQPLVFQIKGVLFEYRGLIGRGTMVYLVSRVGVSSPCDEALKISWPVTLRPLEATTIEKLLKAIPGWKDHLPAVSYSFTQTAQDLELPCVELLKSSQVPYFEDRQLHVLVSKKYEKLWQLDNVEEFQDAFIDCLECKFTLYLLLVKYS